MSTNSTSPEVNNHVSLQWPLYKQPQGSNLRPQRKQISWFQTLTTEPPPRCFVFFITLAGDHNIEILDSTYFSVTYRSYLEGKLAFCLWIISWVKAFVHQLSAHCETGHKPWPLFSLVLDYLRNKNWQGKGKGVRKRMTNRE
jgi:hypothetical protein